MSRKIQVPVKSTSELEVFQNTTEGKLIFTSLKGRKMAFLIQKNRLIAAQVLPEQGSNIGAIYIGRVQKFSSNINAFFVEVGQGEMCFLPAKELCPGQKLKAGDENTFPPNPPSSLCITHTPKAPAGRSGLLGFLAFW